MEITKTKSLYYKDVNLIARPQKNIISRSEIKLNNNKIFISPMSFLVGESFAKKALHNGYSVCLHRFYKDEKEQLLDLYTKLFNNKIIRDNYLDNIWITTGKNTSTEFYKIADNFGCHNILLDIASGYLTKIIDEFFEKIKNVKVKRIGLGNVHDKSILPYYIDKFLNSSAKELYIRCGISSGGCCSTNDNTGFNRGQITEINECYEYLEQCGYKYDELLNQRIFLLADGGIQNGGCAAKAFGAGADCIMTASYWKNCENAETHVIGEHKAYGGASSHQLKKLSVTDKHSEGKEHDLDATNLKTFSELSVQLIGGIKSAISYSGYSSIGDFIGNGKFEVKI
jgi:hypothetical protein